MTTLAFGLKHVVKSWAREIGAATLLGPGAAGFIVALEDALADESNDYVWRLDEIDFDWVRTSIIWYERGEIDRCGYTNWELWRFSGLPAVWLRTKWWYKDVEVANPLETWP